MAGGSRAVTILTLVVVLTLALGLLAPAAEAWSTKSGKQETRKQETRDEAASNGAGSDSEAPEKKEQKKAPAKRFVSRLRSTLNGLPADLSAIDAVDPILGAQAADIDGALGGLAAAGDALTSALPALDGPGAEDAPSMALAFSSAPPAVHLSGAPRPVARASTHEEVPRATVVPATEPDAVAPGTRVASAATAAPAPEPLSAESEPVQWAIVAGALGVSTLPALLVLRRRVERDGLLTHPVRRAMMDIVRARPGITTRGLAEALSLSPRAAMHHARLLAKFSAVDVVREGKFLRHFPRDSQFGRAQKQVHSALSHDVTRAVALALVAEGPQHLGDLTARTALAKSTVLWHVRKLEEAGLATRAGPKAPVTIPEEMLPHLAQALNGAPGVRVDPPQAPGDGSGFTPSRV